MNTRSQEKRNARRRVIAMGVAVDFDREPDGRIKPSTDALRLEAKIALNRSLHELGKALDAARWECDELLVVSITRTMAAISSHLEMADTLRAHPW